VRASILEPKFAPLLIPKVKYFKCIGILSSGMVTMADELQEKEKSGETRSLVLASRRRSPNQPKQ
jgi:hypothetical protein